MVTKNSAADYARRRATTHGDRFLELADALRTGDRTRGLALATAMRAQDGPLGHLDARGLLAKGSIT
jgi:1,4-alpha-glucan branching enzyme